MVVGGGAAGLNGALMLVRSRRSTTMHARLDGLDGLDLPVQDMPHNMGRHVVSGMAGTTPVPGVWVAGNVTELSAQVDASAAALAGAHMNADLAIADTNAAVITRERDAAG